MRLPEALLRRRTTAAHPASPKSNNRLRSSEITQVMTNDSSAGVPGAFPGDVLIVEDDLLIALDVEETILRLGVKTSRTAASVSQALEMIADRKPDFALLNVSLGHETSLAVADRLDALKVSFGFLTGYGARAAPLPRFRDKPKLSKPYSTDTLAAMLRNWKSGSSLRA